MKLTVRLPKGSHRLDGRTATDLLHWAITVLPKCVEEAPVDLEVVIDIDGKVQP